MILDWLQPAAVSLFRISETEIYFKIYQNCTFKTPQSIHNNQNPKNRNLYTFHANSRYTIFERHTTKPNRNHMRRNLPLPADEQALSVLPFRRTVDAVFQEWACTTVDVDDPIDACETTGDCTNWPLTTFGATGDVCPDNAPWRSIRILSSWTTGSEMDNVWHMQRRSRGHYGYGRFHFYKKTHS